jgi:hypothetical protein
MSNATRHKQRPAGISRPELDILTVMCERAERDRTTVKLAPATVRSLVRAAEKGVGR